MNYLLNNLKYEKLTYRSLKRHQKLWTAQFETLPLKFAILAYYFFLNETLIFLINCSFGINPYGMISRPS